MLESVDVTQSYNHDGIHNNFRKEVLCMKEIFLKGYWKCTEWYKSHWTLQAMCKLKFNEKIIRITDYFKCSTALSSISTHCLSLLRKLAFNLFIIFNKLSYVRPFSCETSNVKWLLRHALCFGLAATCQLCYGHCAFKSHYNYKNGLL